MSGRISSRASSAWYRLPATTAARISPVKRTRPEAKIGRGGETAPGVVRWTVSGWQVPSRSAAVKTARTPGADRAAEVSSPAISPQATGLRSKLTWRWPSGCRSSMNWPLPRRRRSSSNRFKLLSFFFSSRRRHTRSDRDWSSDVCSSDLLQRHDLWDQDVEVHQVGYLTEQLGARAVDSVNSYAKSGQPFLISLHFNAPHWPWEGPGDEAESKRLEGTSLRDFDGGARFADTWPFTGKKTDLLEGGLRIPMVIAWPARITPGRTSDQVAISMDWLPTLLAAAGTAPDPGYSPDGMNLLPVLTGNAAAVDRKLFRRYKGKWQRAARIGDYKFLKILDNTFLFNVVEDPLERANLKERHKDVYQRLARDWYEWNNSMLPEIKESYTHSFSGEELADHFGAKKSDQLPDIPRS